MREPKLRKKKVGRHVYWYTQANGEAYFGKVGEVPYETAREHFRKHLGRKQAPDPVDALTVGRLFEGFLAWLKANRSDAQYRRRRRDCSRFARFVYGGRRLADIAALEVTGPMLEAWRENLKASKVDEPEGVNDRDKRGSGPPDAPARGNLNPPCVQLGLQEPQPGQPAPRYVPPLPRRRADEGRPQRADRGRPPDGRRSRCPARSGDVRR